MATSKSVAAQNGKQLQVMLEEYQKGYAYELLALQIQVENSKDQKDPKLMNTLSRLIQLYMIGVEVLESNSDKRYRYFNAKIQSLMKKKHIIEELHLASTGMKAPKHALAEFHKEQRGVRKDEHDIQVFLNAEQCDIKRIKELIKKQEDKFKSNQNKMQKGLKEQEDRINDRIKMRRMKSECFSPRKFDLGSNPAEVKERETMNEQIFPGVPGNRKNLANGQVKRKGSIQKSRPSQVLI